MKTIDTMLYHMRNQCHNLQALKRADKGLTKRKTESLLHGKGDWRFERSGGCSGFRCQKCATWIYENHTRRCDCDSSSHLSYSIVLVDIDDSTISTTVKAYSFEDALTRIRAKFKGYGIKSVQVI